MLSSTGEKIFKGLHRLFAVPTLSSAAGISSSCASSLRSPLPSSAAPSLSFVWNRLIGSSTGKDQTSIQAAIDEINDLFVEARDEIEYAHEEAGTTYFNETYEDAKGMVNEVVRKFDGLLNRVEEEERGRLQRSMGMKASSLGEFIYPPFGRANPAYCTFFLLNKSHKCGTFFPKSGEDLH